MKSILVASVAFCVFGLAMAADPPAAPSTCTASDIRSGRDLLVTLTTPAEQDRALGYIMGVYGVQSGQGVLPAMPIQRRIAELVKHDLLAASPDHLDRPAHKLVQEILEQNRTRLQEIVAQKDPPPTPPR